MGDANERRERIRRFFEKELWPQIPDDVRGKPISKEERERILGYDVFDRPAADDDLDEDEPLSLTVEAQHEVRAGSGDTS